MSRPTWWALGIVGAAAAGAAGAAGNGAAAGVTPCRLILQGPPEHGIDGQSPALAIFYIKSHSHPARDSAAPITRQSSPRPETGP